MLCNVSDRLKVCGPSEMSVFKPFAYYLLSDICNCFVEAVLNIT